MNHRRSLALLLAGTAVTTLGVAACGDDPAPTTEAYCTQLATLPDGNNLFTEFFQQHPDPTLQDWAGFLPGAIDAMHEQRSQMDGIEPSTDMADEKAAALTAFDRVVSNFEQSNDAAQAGDQDRFDELEAQNQDRDVPAMESAFGAIETACGVDPGDG